MSGPTEFQFETDFSGSSGRAWVIHPSPAHAPRTDGKSRRRTDAAALEEAIGLAKAIRLDVEVAETLTLRRIRPATLFGSGQVTEIAERISEADAKPDVVIVDAALTPVQHRNLETNWHCKVVDRTGLILEIFGERAQTREGRLQVELAALTYQRSRLVRSWTHLERQRGGLGFVGGPGESQLEADRRMIDERITRLRRQLADVVRTRDLHRAARRRVPYPIVALVGYTNAGKSTLFNRLTGADVTAVDQLFATLDPTMRAITLPSGRTVILSDTVGFVSALPTDLVAAFRATLEEVVEADLVLHVRDISHPDERAQAEDVVRILRDLGIDTDDRGHVLEALNKIDQLPPEDKSSVLERSRRDPFAVAVSALHGTGTDQLCDLIDERLGQGRAVQMLDVPLVDGAALAWLYRHGDVVARTDDQSVAHMQVALDPADMDRFTRQFGRAAAE